MGKLFIFSLLLLVWSPAYSISLFKNPGQWLRDTGRAIDKHRLKSQDGVADLLSFGHCGRERDKARAAEARAVALEKLRSADKIKQQKARSLTARLATLKADNLADRDVLTKLVSLAKLLNNQEATTFEMITLLIGTNAELSTIVDLIHKQQVDLATFVGDYLAIDAENAILQGVKIKMDLHNEQIGSFPLTDWTEEGVEELLKQAINNSHELVVGLGETSLIVEQSIVQQTKQIEITEADLDTLLKEPKPKAKPAVKKGFTPRVAERPYRDRQGRWILVP